MAHATPDRLADHGNEAPKTWNWWTVLTVVLATTYVVTGAGQESPKVPQTT